MRSCIGCSTQPLDPSSSSDGDSDATDGAGGSAVPNLDLGNPGRRYNALRLCREVWSTLFR